MATLVYVDAENVSFADFQHYAEVNLGGKNITGKVYGSSKVLGDAVHDYLRLGYDFVDTSVIAPESTKNIADMKILTDCAFDVLYSYKGVKLEIVLVTKDCDFLPLVYKLNSIGVSVTAPMIGRDAIINEPLSIVTAALEEIHYDPMASEDWMEYQTDLVYRKLHGSVDYITIDRYYNRKRTRFIHSMTLQDPEIAMDLDKIPKTEFTARAVTKVLRKHKCNSAAIFGYISIYTNKYFGKAFTEHGFRQYLMKLV